MKSMRSKLLIVVFGTLCGVAMAASKSTSSMVTRIKSSGGELYRSEKSDASDKVQDLASNSEIQLLKEGKSRSLIKTDGGVKGWVDNSSIEKVKMAGGSTHNLKDVEVVGWLDNPAAVYVLDGSGPDLSTLPLDRSFASEIVEKKDREEVERVYDEN